MLDGLRVVGRDRNQIGGKIFCMNIESSLVDRMKFEENDCEFSLFRCQDEGDIVPSCYLDCTIDFNDFHALNYFNCLAILLLLVST